MKDEGVVASLRRCVVAVLFAVSCHRSLPRSLVGLLVCLRRSRFALRGT